MTTEPVQLGRRYRDEITGFEGVATGRFQYLYGCVRVSLEGRSVDGKPPEEVIVDEQRLVLADSGERPRATATAGGPRPMPSRGPSPAR